MKVSPIVWFRRLLSPQSLRYQLLSRSLFILSAILVVIGVLQYVLLRQFLYSSQAQTMQNELRSIPVPVWERVVLSNGTVTLNQSTLHALENPNSTIAFIDANGQFYDMFYDWDPDHNMVAPELPPAVYVNALSAPPAGPNAHYLIAKDAHGNQDLIVLQTIGSPGQPFGLVQLSLNTKQLQDVLFRQLTIFIFLALGAFLTGLLTYIPVLRRTLTPLSDMVTAVSRISAGNLDEKFPTAKRQTEIAKLATSFNDMLERLHASFAAEQKSKEQMRQFVADASHELRTPLTSIHGFLEVLLRGASANPAQLKKSLNAMYGESERITKMVQDLLSLARLDREPSFDMKEEQLDKVFSEMEPQLRFLAGERQVVFHIQPLRATFDRDRMKQVVLNLFQNAVQHTDPVSGQIKVGLTIDAGLAKITVEDNGDGIPREHLGRLFERFYRVDASRSRRNGGVGLGLSITQAIVVQHGGTIQVDSEPGVGTRFDVYLPL